MNKNYIGWIGNCITFVSAMLVSDIAQIILFVVGILTSIFTLAYNIYCWVLKAKADNKITKEEVDELKEIVDKGSKDITDIINNNKKGEK